MRQNPAYKRVIQNAFKEKSTSDNSVYAVTWVTGAVRRVVFEGVSGWLKNFLYH